MKTTNPKDYIQLLGTFSIALTNSLLDKKDIIEWADGIITVDSDPDYIIIELSLCGQKSVNDIVSIINEYVGQEKSQISGRVILGFLHKLYLSREITLKKVVSSINWLIWQADLTEKEKDFMYGLEDSYDLAEDNVYGTVKEIESSTLRFLEIYKDFQIDSYKDWKIIDDTIDSKIKVLSEKARQGLKELNEKQGAMTKQKWWKLW